MRLSAEEQTNFMPRTLGPAMLRPGMQYLLSTRSDAKARGIPFVKSTTDTALIELTASYLRPLVSEAVITRASVSTTVTNGDFFSGTGWTTTATGGSTISISGGVLSFSCVPMDSYGTCTRSVTVAAPDQNVEHALRIVVLRGPVYFRCSTSLGAGDYIETTKLDTGTHSLTFTPTGGTVYVELEGREHRTLIVDSIQVEGSGTLTLPAPFAEADLPFVRWEQSGDVVYLACYGIRRYRIERNATRSWSLVTHEEVDGPFLGYTTEPNVTMSINVARGSAGTLTSSRPFFKSTMVGGLIRMFTPGYDAHFFLAQANCFTPAVRINGVGAARTVTIDVTGTWAGTLTVQKSYVAEDSGFTDTAFTTTSNTTLGVTDTSDNTVVWVRIGFKASAYTSGTADCQLIFGNTFGATSTGGRTGVCRILTVPSITTATVDIIEMFSSTQPSLDWFEGEWSDRKGWPSAVGLHEGRMCYAGRSIVGSVSDNYNSFDPGIEGESGPLQRSIGFGPVQVINFLLPLTRLIIGGESAEIGVRSSSFDEPLNPTNFSLKPISTFGSARVPGIRVDQQGLFVDKSKLRLMGMQFSVERNDYVTDDLSKLIPDYNIGNPIVWVAVQRQPDTRIHCVREDGTVMVFVYDPIDDVKCWIKVETDGIVEDVVVLPGDYEDKVYYIVKRTINGQTKRYWERWAQENECEGETLNKQADSFVTFTGPSATITGLSHLEGEEVVVWADGKDYSPLDENGDQETYTVSGGSITLAESVTSAIVGLPYSARFKSAKLAYAADLGTSVGQVKKVSHVGLVLHKTHYKGVRHSAIGFDHLDNMPEVKDGTTVAADTVYDHHDEPMVPTNGEWNADSRLYIEAMAPRPCTILGVTFGIQANSHGR